MIDIMTATLEKTIETCSAQQRLEAVLRPAQSVPSQCTSLNLRRASRAASQFLESYLQPVNLHASQFGILSHLSRSGSLTMTGLADEMSLDRTTLTRNVQILVRERLVEVIRGKDKRVREIALTEHGREIYEQALPLWNKAEAALTTYLGEDQRQAMLAITRSLSLLYQP